MMGMVMRLAQNSLRTEVAESSQVGEVRRLATRLAEDLAFGQTEGGKVAIVVSEAAANLAKHAAGGELLLRALERCGVGGIEVLALDRGPGMVNVAECLRDGYSTVGGPGIGLGAVVRLAELFDIHSLPGVGTGLLARLWAKPGARECGSPEPKTGVVCLPHPGEKICGDAWAVGQRPTGSVVLVADGLGHGPSAAEAAREAVHVFENNPGLSPAELIEAAHAALHHTRGAALAVARVDVPRQTVHFAGVGNISGVILSPEGNRHMLSHAGTVGHVVRKIQESEYPWPETTHGHAPLLVMHSDGLATHWSLGSYPGLATRHPALVAGVLYRDHGRRSDDVTVVVVRLRNADAIFGSHDPES